VYTYGLVTVVQQLSALIAVPVTTGFYPSVTFQYRSTTLFQFSYHIQHLFF
jgi:hypothetical protein